MITISAPGKIHLLGEHAVVYGKPALLTTVGLRIAVTITPSDITSGVGSDSPEVRRVIEPIVKKELKFKKLPPYTLKIESQIPIGSGLGSSAAVSACYIAALLTLLKVKWDLELVNKLAYEAEKVFHGNPSGADNSTIVYGGLVWYRKEAPDVKIIHPLPFSIPEKLAKNFVLINTGKPEETTKAMVEMVSSKFNLPAGRQEVQNSKIRKIFDDQERLVRNLLEVLKNADEAEFIRTIRAGEKNLESIGVCSPSVKKIIRQIEKSGGAAKICGAGGKTKATGIVLAYHKDKKVIEKIAEEFKLNYFSTELGVEGLRLET